MISSKNTLTSRLRDAATRLRIRYEHGSLLPTGPEAAGPWAGRPELDRDRTRVRADLDTAPRSPDLTFLEPWARRTTQRPV